MSMTSCDRPFPFVVDEHEYNVGLSMRDYIAIKAMQAIVSRKAYFNLENDTKECFEIADALMKESQKEYQNGL